MKKRLIVSLACFSMLIILTGCSNEETTSENSSTEEIPSDEVATENLATSENTDIVEAISDSTYFFTSAEEIVPESSVMVTGEVVESEGFVYSGDNGETFHVMTLVKVRVEEDYLDQISGESEVYFVEPGGTVPTSEIPPQAEKDFNTTTEEPASEYTQVIYNGTPNSEVGDQVLFFGDEVEGDFYNLNLGEPYYSTIGSEQSRFVLDSESNEYFRPFDESIGTNNPIVISNDEDELSSLAGAK